MSNDIQEIVITVSIYDYQNRKQNFGQVERAYVRLYKSRGKKPKVRKTSDMI
ncbi:MAG: TerD family protein [Bacteroides sp.]